MRLLFCILFISTFTTAQTSASGTASSQTNASTQAASAGSASQSQAATVVPAALSKSVDSKKAKVGDEVSAKTLADVRTADGVVIPKDSKLLGKVTQASARGKGDTTSSLGIAFDRAMLKGGKSLSLVSTIQAMVAAPPPPPPMTSDSSMGPDPSASSTGGYGSNPSSGGGPLGGLGSTAGGAVGDVGRTAGSAAGNVSGAAGSAVGVATPVAGSNASITSSTTGVVGLKNLELSSSSDVQASGSIITSTDKSVKVDGGTRLLINVTSATSNEGATK